MATYTSHEYKHMFDKYHKALRKTADAMFRFLEARKELEIARYGYELVPMICRLVQTLYDMVDTPWVSDETKYGAMVLLGIMKSEFEHLNPCDYPLTILEDALADKLYERHTTEKAFIELAPMLSSDERERIQSELEAYYNNLIDTLEYVIC